MTPTLPDPTPAGDPDTVTETYQVPICFIEFRIRDERRFAVFTRFFDALKIWLQRPVPSSITADAADSTHQSRQYNKTEDWMLNFRPQDLKTLGMPDHATAIDALKSWYGLSRRERRNRINYDPMLQKLADFSDMLKYFRDVDYDLVKWEQPASDYARIELQPHSNMIENRAALEELLFFFGFFVIIRQSCD